MSEGQPQGGQPQGSGAAMGLGIAGLVIGIVSLLISFIPCLGALAIYPGAVAVILAGVGLGLSMKANKVSGLSVAALCVSVIACGIAGWQYYTINKGLKELKKGVDDAVDEAEKRRQEEERKRKEREANKTKTKTKTNNGFPN